MNEVLGSQREEIHRALQGDEQLRRDQQLLHEQLLEQNRELREFHEKSLNEMEELKRFEGSTFETFSRRKLIGNAGPQRWAAKHLGYEWYIGKRFCKSNGVFFSTLSAGIESMEF